MLDPVWHRVGPKTRQLVGDLAVLRRLLSYVRSAPSPFSPLCNSTSNFYFIVLITQTHRYLLTYDALAFHAYLETILASNSTTASGTARQHQSPCLFTDAANTVFQAAKRRCYSQTQPSRANPRRASATPAPAPARGLDEDEDAWAVLDEMDGVGRGAAGNGARGSGNKNEGGAKRRPRWLPEELEPQLEELPKWSLLAEILEEIEQEIMRMELQKGITRACAFLLLCIVAPARDVNSL